MSATSGPISEAEKQLVLELLPAALNAAGISLALADPRLGVMERAQQVIYALADEDRVWNDQGIWRVGARP